MWSCRETHCACISLTMMQLIPQHCRILKSDWSKGIDVGFYLFFFCLFVFFNNGSSDSSFVCKSSPRFVYRHSILHGIVSIVTADLLGPVLHMNEFGKKMTTLMKCIRSIIWESEICSFNKRKSIIIHMLKLSVYVDVYVRFVEGVSSVNHRKVSRIEVFPLSSYSLMLQCGVCFCFVVFFFCRLNFKREEKREPGEGTTVYSC